MQREPKTFLSKAWSGSSLAAGTTNMFAAFVKQEQALPDDEIALQQRVQDSVMSVHVCIEDVTSTVVNDDPIYVPGSTPTAGYGLGCQKGACLGCPILYSLLLLELSRNHATIQSSLDF